jgi:serine/threonine-protein kinase
MHRTLDLPPEPLDLQKVGNVELHHVIAKGVTADVYHGHHPDLGRPVAVKLIQHHLAGVPEVIDRFRQEARAAAALRHPNIVQVYDFGSAGGRLYIVMEYLPGPTLAQLLAQLASRKETLAPSTALHLAHRLAAALDYAHRQGVIHRDVKPANVGLRPAGEGPSGHLPGGELEPVLMDFGVARLMRQGLVTAAGAFLGSPAYMSPEQILGESVDGRSDIYALGIVLYEMLAGRLPLEPTGLSVSAILRHHLNGDPPHLPPHLAGVQGILDKCLSRSPDGRYATAGDLAEQLLAIRRTAGHSTPTVSVSTRQRPRRRPLPVRPIRRRNGLRRILIASVVGLIPVLAAAAWAIGLVPTLRAQTSEYAGRTVLASEFDKVISEMAGAATEAGPTATVLPTEPTATTGGSPSPTTASPTVPPSATPTSPPQATPTVAPSATEAPILPHLPTSPIPLPTLPPP